MTPRRFWLSIGGATLVLLLGCWLSSGTLAPYGMQPGGPCHYRVNIDHEQFHKVFLMLDGRPAAEWSDSVVLRRVLHPLLAYPWMKAFGFDLGGLLFNMVLHALALVALALALRRFFDARAAVLTSWLFATYPGYAYWVGLPYSYAFIVPGSIACLIALLWLHERPSLQRSLAAACVVGVVGLGYDLLPFFGGALLLLLLASRRWLDLALAIVTLLAWALFVAKGLPAIFGFPALNSNTQAYAEVVRAWADAPHRTHGWGSLLFDAPKIFASNFFLSNFVFFPALLVWLVGLRPQRPVFHRVALAVMLAALALFLFLNLAPPYEGAWQLRGTWIPRLYQPWFVAVLVSVAAASIALRNSSRYKLFVWSVVTVAVLDGAVIAGPFIGLTPLYAGVYQRFYRAWAMNHNATWLDKLGRRPYGICE
ncbi:MAG TPA: hypothetical protein VL326_36745 [Kofleriaceae bacterium]|nr:hypothetical protein [Kofleriaceae bacterium]